MTPTQENAVRHARSLLGTPWHHQARTPGVGVDCIGLVLVVATMLGNPAPDEVYGTWPEAGRMERWFRSNPGVFEPVSVPEPGDIRTFWLTRRDTLWHAGIVSDVGIIHTHLAVMRVVEDPLGPRWIKRAGPAFRFVPAKE